MKDDFLKTQEKKVLINDSVNKAKEVLSDAANQKDRHTGTIFERVFASMWLKMPLTELECHRALLNKIIAEKKTMRRIKEREKNAKQ
jgi:hypothetical protein